jgi:hypothetical protein
MVERVTEEKEWPNSRIFEAVFPWKFNENRRARRMREYFDVLYDNYKIIEEPQEIERGVFWTTVSFNQENDLSVGHRKGRINILQKNHKIRMVGITIEQAEEKRLRRAS